MIEFMTTDKGAAEEICDIIDDLQENNANDQNIQSWTKLIACRIGIPNPNIVQEDFSIPQQLLEGWQKMFPKDSKRHTNTQPTNPTCNDVNDPQQHKLIVATELMSNCSNTIDATSRSSTPEIVTRDTSLCKDKSTPVKIKHQNKIRHLRLEQDCNGPRTNEDECKHQTKFHHKRNDNYRYNKRYNNYSYNKHYKAHKRYTNFNLYQRHERHDNHRYNNHSPTKYIQSQNTSTISQKHIDFNPCTNKKHPITVDKTTPTNRLDKMHVIQQNHHKIRNYIFTDRARIFSKIDTDSCKNIDKQDLLEFAVYLELLGISFDKQIETHECGLINKCVYLDISLQKHVFCQNCIGSPTNFPNLILKDNQTAIDAAKQHKRKDMYWLQSLLIKLLHNRGLMNYKDSLKWVNNCNSVLRQCCKSVSNNIGNPVPVNKFYIVYFAASIRRLLFIATYYDTNVLLNGLCNRCFNTFHILTVDQFIKQFGEEEDSFDVCGMTVYSQAIKSNICDQINKIIDDETISYSDQAIAKDRKCGDICIYNFSNGLIRDLAANLIDQLSLEDLIGSINKNKTKTGIENPLQPFMDNYGKMFEDIVPQHNIIAQICVENTNYSSCVCLKNGIGNFCVTLNAGDIAIFSSKQQHAYAGQVFKNQLTKLRKVMRFTYCSI